MEEQAERRRRSGFIMNFLARAIVGLVMIFFVNMMLEDQHIDVHVGLNPVSFVTTGVLGMPGVALLYGIAFYF